MPKRLTVLAALVAVLCLATAAPAQEPQITGAQITEVGIFTVEVIKSYADQGVVRGDRRIVRNYVLVQPGTNIPLLSGTTFGFNFTLLGSPADAPVNVQIKLIHPPFTPTGGGAPRTLSQTQAQFHIAPKQHLSYTLGKTNRSPGTYTFQIFHQGRKLAEQSFTVREH